MNEVHTFHRHAQHTFLTSPTIICWQCIYLIIDWIKLLKGMCTVKIMYSSIVYH